MRGSALALVALAACAPDFRPAARRLGAGLEAREPFVQRRAAYFDLESTRLRREWSYEVLADGTQRAHGRELQNYPDGRREFEREFRHGEPVGAWRSWWPDGTPRMEAHYGSGEPRPMRWWHASGQLEADGLAHEGVKTGPWRHFHADGSLASQGCYANGERTGEWSFFDERGTLLESVEYREGVRVRRLSAADAP